jgi:flagellar protein FliS
MATRLSKAYLLTKVLTANRQEVVVYLYQGAISYLHRARTALAEERADDMRAAIERVVGIVVELSGNLNYTTGGHLALRLDSIYNYLIETLTLASARGDDAALESCEGILVILNDAWQQAAALSAKQMPLAPAAQLRISA